MIIEIKPSWRWLWQLLKLGYKFINTPFLDRADAKKNLLWHIYKTEFVSNTDARELFRLAYTEELPKSEGSYEKQLPLDPEHKARYIKMAQWQQRQLEELGQVVFKDPI